MRTLRGLLVLGIAGLAACDDDSGVYNPPHANTRPSAAFTRTCDGLTCTLIDRSTDADGTIQAHAWEFGDGDTSTEQNPTHTYPVPGAFAVRLTVTDDDGETGSVAEVLTVTAIDTVPGYSGIYVRETPHTRSDRHSRYVLHANGRFELHDRKGTDSRVYLGSWGLFDPHTPWIDFDFDDFVGNCDFIGRHSLEGRGVLLEISGATYLSISYCGQWYLEDRRDGDYLEEGFYASTAFVLDLDPPPPQAGQLAFVREGRIHVANPDGTGITPVSQGPGDGEPAWSPDGGRIAFTRSGGTEPGIYVMNADGSNLVRRTSAGKSPTWSPDGASLAFECGSPSRDICSIDVDGAGSPVVVWPETPGALCSFPAWSPQGSRIAFTSDYEGYDFFFDIFVVTPQGSDLTALTPRFRRQNLAEFYQSAWSPDGQRIACVTCPWAFQHCSSSVVSVLQADGTNLRWLTAASGFARPAWSPDGQLIAFASANAIEWIRADGSERGRILANGHSPAWRP